MPKRNKDTLFKTQLNQLADFEFNANVVGVFEDMINRSVPGYGSIVHSLSHFADQFSQANTNCYDLGCSLGASSIAMLKGLKHDDTQIIAVDNSRDMIKRARHFIDAVDELKRVSILEQDAVETHIENASMVTLNFLMQFIQPKQRFSLLENIFNGMNEGGCIVLSEKVRFTNSAAQARITDLHHQFKADHDYSELEIAQKRDSLENVMKLDTQEQHIERLLSVGFKEVQQWYQNTAFVSFYAIK